MSTGWPFIVATTFGHDKETMADRVQWTRDNVSLIAPVSPQDPAGETTNRRQADALVLSGSCY